MSWNACKRPGSSLRSLAGQKPIRLTEDLEEALAHPATTAPAILGRRGDLMGTNAERQTLELHRHARDLSQRIEQLLGFERLHQRQCEKCSSSAIVLESRTVEAS